MGNQGILAREISASSWGTGRGRCRPSTLHARGRAPEAQKTPPSLGRPSPSSGGGPRPRDGGRVDPGGGAHALQQAAEGTAAAISRAGSAFFAQSARFLRVSARRSRVSCRSEGPRVSPQVFNEKRIERRDMRKNNKTASSRRGPGQTRAILNTLVTCCASLRRLNNSSESSNKSLDSRNPAGAAAALPALPGDHSASGGRRGRRGPPRDARVPHYCCYYYYC